jgi:hypothetical protein
MNTWKIRTKVIPATDTIGTRVKATCNGRTKSIPYPYALSGEEVHKKAAWAWVEKHMTRQSWESVVRRSFFTSRFTLTTHYCDKMGYSFEVLKNTL